MRSCLPSVCACEKRRSRGQWPIAEPIFRPLLPLTWDVVLRRKFFGMLTFVQTPTGDLLKSNRCVRW